MFRGFVYEHINEARTLAVEQALDDFNAFQLCHEMHWTWDELCETPDEFVWACLAILDLQGKKQREDMDDTKDGRRSAGSSGGGQRGIQNHHRDSSPPSRVSDDEALRLQQANYRANH